MMAWWPLFVGPWLASFPLRAEPFLHLGVEEGLAHSTVWAVAQGRRGDLWVGTEAGLQRWDGYRFTTYLHDPDDPTSLSSSEVMAMTVDHRGELWLATRQDGLNRYDAATDSFVRYLGPSSPTIGRPPRRLFNSLFEDSLGTLWVGTGEGLYSLDSARVEFAHYLLAGEEMNDPGNVVISLSETPRGRLWVGTDQGLVTLSLAAGEPRRLDDWTATGDSTAAVTALWGDDEEQLWIGTSEGRLYRWSTPSAEPIAEPAEAVAELASFVSDVRGWEGLVWAATYGSGLLRLDPESGKSEQMRQDPLDPSSLASDRIVTLVTDRSGSLWIATRGGLHQLHRDRRRFEVLTHRGSSAPLGGGVVLGVEVDRHGMLWTSGDGWIRVIDRAEGSARAVGPTTVDGTAIGQIEEIIEDRQGRLWLGGGNGLFYLDPPTFELSVFEPLAEAAIRCMVASSDGTLWIGRSLDQGVDRLDPSSGELVGHYPAEGVAYSLLEDRSGRLWVGTSDGLDRHDPAGGETLRFRHRPSDPDSLGYASIGALLEDRQGTVWIGLVGAGLARFDEGSGTFESFRTGEGLPHDNVVGLLEDDTGRLWVATHAGLASFEASSRSFRSFDVGDGLAGNAFLIGPNDITRDGELIFGAAGGLTIFDPSDFDLPPFQPPVAITGVAVDGESVVFSASERLELTHRQKAVSFLFTAFDFANPARTHYRYRLQGYDEWTPVDALHRRARYTNLDPGTYVFEAQAASPGGSWPETGSTLEVRVHPSPWLSWWAYLAYASMLAGAVGLYLRGQRLELARQRAAAELERKIAERERAVSQRLRAVDRLKDEFLANTSHELRTPLFGITGLAESLLAGSSGELPTSARENLELIVASGQRLGHLVSDILDFSKIRHESLSLTRVAVDLRPLVDVVLALSRPLAGSKQLELENQVPLTLVPVSADENRLMQILHNLVGNAVKFTGRGKVVVSAKAEGKRVVVGVSDTGPGIPVQERERIFEAFSQVEGTAERVARGTGLGLAVTRQLVELHGGTISVKDAGSGGSLFLFDLPAAAEAAIEALAAATRDQGSTTGEGGASPETPFTVRSTWGDASESVTGGDVGGVSGESMATLAISDGEVGDEVVPSATDGVVGHILVVDDEPINRRILTQHLVSDGHRVSSAASGPEALAMVGKEVYDLVLLDVMMPRMSGFEVCRTLRRSVEVEALPVIFLTAKGQSQDLVVGLAAGANDYLSKPVARSELLARVKTHLALLGVHRQLSQVLEERSEQVEERSRLLREREQLIEELEDRHAELARFNYTVSHDLKNPLVTIRNFLGSLRNGLEGGQSQRFEEDLGRLDRAADDMQRLLEDLDKFSRAGSHDGSLSPVGLGELVQAVRHGLRARLERAGIELVIAADLPTVVGDRGRLAEALRQLLDNAVRFTADFPEPRIEIGVRDQDDAVVLTVADNGAGVDPRYHEKIFELFHRLDPGTGGGTGVGLALVRRIVETHGGRVWVESKGIGEGSTFCVRLPTIDLLEQIRRARRTG